MKYRVDRANKPEVPVGMNSILYVGPSWLAARKCFDRADIGLDAWGQPNPTYGVILSTWDTNKNDYVVQMKRGIK